MKHVTYIPVVAIVISLAFCSCRFPSAGLETSLVISVNMPSATGFANNASGAKFIAPGTSKISITLSPADGSAALTRDFEVVSNGNMATLELNNIKDIFGETTVLVVASDGTGAAVSSGSVNKTITLGRNDISLTLSLSGFEETGIYMDTGTLWSDTLLAGQVRVHRFQLNSDGLAEYSISIGNSPCLLGVYDSSFNRMSNVSGTSEKWALRTESTETEYFYVVVSNTTSESAIPYEIKCETAYYVNSSGIAGSGTRASPAPAANLQVMYTARPLYTRIVMQGGTFTGPLSLANHKSMYGGFSTDGNWNRDLLATPTVIRDNIIENNGYCILADVNVSRDTIIDGLVLTAVDYLIGSVSGVTYNVLSITGGPVVTNCRIQGPGVDCDSTQNFPQIVRGVNIAYATSAYPGPILAYNSIVGGRVVGIGSVPTIDTSVAFCGINVTGYSGILAVAPLLISNDIIAWIGQDSPGTSPVFTISATGILSSGKMNLVNNTIDAGHTLTPWSGIAISSEQAYNPSTTADLTLSRNNLLGISDSSAAAANQTVYYAAGAMSPGYLKFHPTFFYRALPGANLANLYPGSAVPAIATVAVTIPGAIGANNASGNLGIFLDPTPTSGFGNRRLSGTAVNSTANPATAGETILTDPDFVANLTSLDIHYLRWDRDGKQRTAPWSVGAYEY